MATLSDDPREAVAQAQKDARALEAAKMFQASQDRRSLEGLGYLLPVDFPMKESGAVDLAGARPLPLYYLPLIAPLPFAPSRPLLPPKCVGLSLSSPRAVTTHTPYAHTHTRTRAYTTHPHPPRAVRLPARRVRGGPQAGDGVRLAQGSREAPLPQHAAAGRAARRPRRAAASGW